MSQYPPPPSFRGPFNPNPQLTPSSSAAHHAVPQFPYHPFRDPNNQSLPSAQFAQSYSYNAASHSANASLAGPGAHQAPYVGFGQSSNISFLQPPYPPIPPPYGVFPQPPPLVHRREPSLGSIQPHNSLPLKPPPVAAMVDGPDFEKSQTITANISELEDGELSDGELAKDQRESASDVPTTSRDSAKRDDGSPSESVNINGGMSRKTGNISKADNEKDNRCAKMSYSPHETSQAHSLNNLANQVQKAFNPQELVHTVPPRSSMDNFATDQTGQRHAKSGDSWSSSQKIMKNLAATSGSIPQNTLAIREAADPAEVSRNASPQADVALHRKWQDLHDRAKDALKQLYDDGIGFAQIANEGIDPTVLRNLYTELAIPVPLATQANQNGIHRTPVGCASSPLETTEPLPRAVKNISQKEGENNAINSPKKSNQSAQNLEMFKDSPNASISKGTANQSSLLLKENIGNSVNKIIGGNTSAHDSHTLDLQSSTFVSKPTQTTKAPKLATNNLLGKSTASKTGDKTLERKDYIARMLAAKTGKPISTAISAVSPSPSTNRPKETVPKKPLVGESQLGGIEERCVYVDNIPYTTTEGDLRNIFSGFEIESVSIEDTLPTNKSTASGVLVLSSATEAHRAISEVSNKHILGRKVSIQLARKTDGTTHAVEVAVQAEDQSAIKIVSDSMSKSEMDSKANKRAQTELARQKIEALKNRVINVPPPTVHHSTVQGPLSSRDQQMPVEELQSKLVHQEPPAASKPTAIPQIQGPFFTSANPKPAFVIPGLFMDSTPLESSTLPEQSKVQIHTEELQDKLELNLATEVGSSEPERLIAHSQTPAFVHPRVASVLSTYPDVQKQSVAMVGITNESKKRQKAADFIEPPSVRVRRPLGQNEETSVIIEISEDETNGDTEDEKMDIDDDIAMDIDEDNGQHTPPKQLFSTESASGKPTSIRDLPPLSDFPGRKKISSNTPAVTPPAAQTPSKSREPGSLKIKEKEIELMNRRIAELEQRIKAKQTASRAHTPGTPGSSAASPKLSAVTVGSHEKPRSGVGDKEPNRALKDRSEDRNLKEEMETAEAASVVESAEIAATTKAIAAIKTPDLAKDSDTVEAAKIVEVAEVDEAARLAELAKAAGAAEAAATAKMAELAKTAMATEAAKTIEQERLLAEPQAKALQLVKADAERLRAAEAAAAEEEKQRQARRAEIESGLPILDAEVEKTKRKLELLKQEMDDLSREVKKGIEGRRILMEELNGLTPLPKAPSISEEQIHVNVSDTHAPEPIEERHELSSFGHRIDIVEQQQNVQARPNNNDDIHSPLSTVPLDYLPKIFQDQRAISENRDVMDTSPDSLDDAEVTDYSPEPPTKIPVTPGSVDTEEVYEPPVTVDTISIPPAFPRNEDLGHELHMAETGVLQMDPNASPSEVDGRRRSQGSDVIGDSSNDVDAPYEPPASIRSTNFADASDSDDYEPPEPSPPVEKSLLSPVNAASDIVSSLHDPAAGVGPPSHSMPADSITIVREQMKADGIGSIDISTKPAFGGVSDAKVAKFTPYESPLKQFKSYRYHPDYLSEVPRGFRSLTYSHDIDPEKRICQFEAAGGVCNDNSCDGQHFRNMSLSDDMVLVQMGAIPEGLTSQEGDAYANGLRRIIQEIRGRKVRDFNAVASEITAYRAKFLGDNLKVLPL